MASQEQIRAVNDFTAKALQSNLGERQYKAGLYKAGLTPSEVNAYVTEFNGGGGDELAELKKELEILKLRKDISSFSGGNDSFAPKNLSEQIALDKRNEEVATASKQKTEGLQKLQGTLSVIEDVKARIGQDDGFSASVGRKSLNPFKTSGLLPFGKAPEPRIATAGADFLALKDQLVSRLIVDARQELKGQGTITDREQDTLAAAETSLNNPNISEEEFKRQVALLENTVKSAIDRQSLSSNESSSLDPNSEEYDPKLEFALQNPTTKRRRDYIESKGYDPDTGKKKVDNTDSFQAATATEQTEDSFIDKSAQFIGDFFGGEKIGEAIGDLTFDKEPAKRIIADTVAKVEKSYNDGQIDDTQRKTLLTQQENLLQELHGYDGPSARQLVGDLGKIGLNFIGGAAIKGAQGALGLAKAGAKFGAAEGFAESQSEGAGLVSTIAQTAGGTALGFAAGPVIDTGLRLATRGTSLLKRNGKNTDNLTPEEISQINDNSDNIISSGIGVTDKVLGSVVKAGSKLVSGVRGGAGKVASKVNEAKANNLIQLADNNPVKAEEEIVDLYKRGIVPGVKKKNKTQQNIDNINQSVKRIALKFANKDIEDIDDLAQAVTAEKRDIWTNIEKQIEEAEGQNIAVNLDDFFGELNKIKSEEVYSIDASLRKAVESVEKEFGDVRNIKPSTAQTLIASLNDDLQAFYRGSTKGTSAGVQINRLLVNNLRKATDDAVDKLDGKSFADLKKEYADLKNVEDDVVHRAVFEGQKGEGLAGLTDIFSAGDFIAGFTDPTFAVRGIAQFGSKEFLQQLTNKDEIIRQMMIIGKRLKQNGHEIRDKKGQVGSKGFFETLKDTATSKTTKGSVNIGQIAEDVSSPFQAALKQTAPKSGVTQKKLESFSRGLDSDDILLIRKYIDSKEGDKAISLPDSNRVLELVDEFNIKKNPSDKEVLSVLKRISDIRDGDILEKIDSGKAGSKAKSVTDDKLIKEAKKFDSFEDFSKSLGQPLLHGGEKKIKDFSSGESGRDKFDPDIKRDEIFFTDSVKEARFYAKSASSGDESGDITIGYVLSNNGKNVDAGGKDYSIDLEREIIDQAKKEGYDFVKVNNIVEQYGGGIFGDNKKQHFINSNQTIVLDKKIIKTKDQLKEIYKKAK